MASLAVLKRTIALPVDNAGDDCDCGREKPLAAECCGYCAFLDGVNLMPLARGQRRAEVIAAMRVVVRMTLNEIAIAVYGEANKSSIRATHRILHELMEHGRVTRFLEEWTSPIEHTLASSFGGDARARMGAQRWVYSLVGGGQ